MTSAVISDWKVGLTPPPKDLRPRTTDVTETKGSSYEEFCIKTDILKGAYEMGWEEPSPVQEDTIHLSMAGKDLVARAKNGTGKTGAYCIPVLSRIDPAISRPQALILVPVRELALQTANTCQKLAKHTNIKVGVIMGGSQMRDDVRSVMHGCQVLVATPGRALDILSNPNVSSDDIKILVLDEADKLLSTGFIQIIEQLMELLPSAKQTQLFSATFPAPVKNFVDKYLKLPVMINTMNELTLKGVTQYYAFVSESKKVHCLNTLFQRLVINQAIIFCNSTQRVELLAKKITDLGFSCFYIHSKMKQQNRNRVFHDFRAGACRNLVGTDLVTRGIDVPGVNVVINFDFPDRAESYLHRIGRSGRYGHHGLAINLITENDRRNMAAIESELGTQILPVPKTIDPSLYVAEAQISMKGEMDEEKKEE